MRRVIGKDKYIILWGIISALLTLLVGFISMHIFWINDIHDPNLRGFFSYKAATFGDGICLPVLVGCSVVCLLYGKEEKIGFYKPCIYIGIIGAILGIVVQGSWLISDETLPNWTIPEVHHFTAAGYYHAIFFVLMFGYIGFAFSAIWRLRRRRGFSVKQEFCFWGIISSGSGFLYCLALDDWTINNTSYEALFKAFLIVLLVMILFSATSSIKRFRRDFGIIISAEFSSLAIVIAALNYGTNLYFFFLAIAEATFLVVLVKPELHRFFNQLFHFFMLACPIFTLNLALYSFYQIDDIRLYLFFITIIAVGILIAYCLETYDKLSRECMPLFFLIPVYLFVSVFLKTVDDNALYNMGQIADALATMGVYFILKYYIQKKLFCIIQKKDEDISLSKRQDRKIKLSVYFNIVVILVGSILFFYDVIILSFDAINYSDVLNISILRYMIMCILLLLCTVVCTIFIQKIPYYGIRKFISLWSIGVYYALLCWNTISHIENIRFDWGILLSVFPTLGSSWMVAKGYYNNLLNLRGIENKKIDRAFQGIIFLGNAVNTFAISSMIFSARSSNDANLTFLVNIIVLFLGFIVGPTISGIINKYSYIDTKFIRAESYIGIAQDGFTSLLIIMLAGVIPMYYYRQLSSQDVITQITGFVLGIITIITMIYWPYRYCLENNRNHYKIKCEEYKRLALEYPEYEKILAYQKKSLKEHLTFQNKFSYIAVFPYLFVWDGVQKLLNKYIDKKELFYELAFKGICDEKKD